MPILKRGIYFNEWKSFQCKWIRRLYPCAVVDERDIKEVTPDDVKKYKRVHLFAGIAGWEYALELAGWPESILVWSGSCPCQPFSNCGKREETDDERHLWPEMFRLIKECRPTTVFGEQVSGSAGFRWIDGVSSNLGNIGYAVGVADLSSASVNSPHNRKRLFWVAYSEGSTRIRTVMRENKRTHNRIPDGLRAWDRFEEIKCPGDNQTRRIEPGTLPMVDGIPSEMGRGSLISRQRSGRIDGYGNAIVPQLAAVFIRAFMDVIDLEPCTRWEKNYAEDSRALQD